MPCRDFGYDDIPSAINLSADSLMDEFHVQNTAHILLATLHRHVLKAADHSGTGRMSVIGCTAWVPRGAAKANPEKVITKTASHRADRSRLS